MPTFTPTHFGVDLSSNNAHPIDYAATVADLRSRGDGAQPFVVVKATQGTDYVNPFFAVDVAGFRAAGAAVGAYLMDQGNADPAAEEAFFRRIAGPLPQFDDDELPMGNNAYAQHCAALLAQNPGASDYLNQSEEDAGYPLGVGGWEANYNDTPGVVHHDNVVLHQFSSTANVAGIHGPVDLNAWLGSEQQFDVMFGLAPAAPTPEVAIVKYGKLDAPVVRILERPNHPDTGWMFCADGGVINYGGAPFYGSYGNVKLDFPVVDAIARETGYTMIGQDGGTFTCGNGAPKIPSQA